MSKRHLKPIFSVRKEDEMKNCLINSSNINVKRNKTPFVKIKEIKEENSDDFSSVNKNDNSSNISTNIIDLKDNKKNEIKNERYQLKNHFYKNKSSFSNSSETKITLGSNEESVKKRII